MHNIEPYYNWRDQYTVEEDEKSPFFGKEYSEFQFSTKIYNYFIHPQWDEMGSPTLFLKMVYVNYLQGFAVIELMGEWNDCLHNDIMFFKRNILNKLMEHGVSKFILIGENVLNFHFSDDCYYEEWYEEVADEGGWIVCMNFRKHVLEEMEQIRLSNYLLYGGHYNAVNWRACRPNHFCQSVEDLIMKKLAL